MKIQKKLGAAVLSLGLVVGLSGFAGATTGTIDTTGPHSDNSIESETSQRVEVENNNKLNVHNDNDQRAWTGDAHVDENTTGGDATTGSATNENALHAAVTVDNSASVRALGVLGDNGNGGDNHATIKNTGPHSDNSVRFESKSNVNIENNNDLHVTNTNDQHASSGNARVTENTTGGSATTGDASNSNTTTIKFDVTN